MHIDGLPLKTIDDPINTPFHALLGRQILIWYIIFKRHKTQATKSDPSVLRGFL